MLIRLRPGWEVLRPYLAGEGDHAKPRWGVVEGYLQAAVLLISMASAASCFFICRWAVAFCTTAEREYSLEVTRLLDPTGSLKPRPGGHHAILNVDRKGTSPKSMASVLGLDCSSGEIF